MHLTVCLPSSALDSFVLNSLGLEHESYSCTGGGLVQSLHEAHPCSRGQWEVAALLRPHLSFSLKPWKALIIVLAQHHWRFLMLVNNVNIW